MKKIMIVFLIVIIITIITLYVLSNNVTQTKLEVRLDGKNINNLIIENKDDVYLVSVLPILEELSLDYEITADNIIIDENIKINYIDEYFVSLDQLQESLHITNIYDDELHTFFLESKNELLIDYIEALEIFKEGKTATVTDVQTGIKYNIRRVIGGFSTLADIEPLTKEDTANLLMTTNGNWDNKRRAVIVTIDNINIAGSIAPLPHSGRDDMPFGEIVDNRSGATGSGINLNSIRDNDVNGVIDIYFYNSHVPGLNRIDARHQEMVIKAATTKVTQL